ncbi:dethiobiotin synthase [Thalassotalea atypica]|uniref:dethiobiotin synthase n=1 Tax=Thalassotalea atypica TaxID=2054316 RepID=UPI0025742CE6|nr:dethiobiotin synthase [Thalassotalea atypica]
MIKFFITATDTDAGKTLIASALIKMLAQQYNVAAFKPISAGCELVGDQLINEDAALLTAQANCQQSISSVNPIAFKEPIAPHIAAANNGVDIILEDVTKHFHAIESLMPDVLITEGAGGWRLPLGNNKFLSEFAKQTKQSVILVVNMKLGCLNHAVLSYESIINDGLDCVGWVANCPETMNYQKENIDELTKLLDAPLLGVIPFVNNIDEVVDKLDVTPLL